MKLFYFNSFGVEYIPEEIKDFIKKLLGNKKKKLTFFEHKKTIQ